MPESIGLTGLLGLVGLFGLLLVKEAGLPIPVPGDLLVINTSEIDFVERSDDLQQLLRRLQDPVKGTQYFLPLGASE